jgi:hypothetical protein
MPVALVSPHLHELSWRREGAGAVTWIPNSSNRLTGNQSGVGALTDIATLFVLWSSGVFEGYSGLLGWGVFHVAGGLIHVLLVVAVIVFLINLISGRRTV